MTRSPAPRPVALVLTIGLLALFTMNLAAQSPEPSFKEVDRLISEQRYEAAAEMTEKLGESARQAGDAQAWTRALVRRTELRLALSGYATAVRELRDAAWPEAPRYRVVLELVVADALVKYSRAYSWEIRQRERVAADEELDLDTWTLDQIIAEAHRAYLAAWQGRQAWGDTSLGELAEYFVPGEYPAHIRGTLRDTVAYLWVDLFADQSLWRAEHANELFRLDRDRLLGGDAGAFDDLDLADPDVHPLRKLAAVLADLEDWHLEKSRPEAAFEAARVRLERLTISLATHDDDRKAIRHALEKRLVELGRPYPWWARGRTDLAELVRRSDAPDALVEARAIALEGAETHPKTFGGKLCRQIVEEIEWPSFETAAMQTDALDRRSIQIRHKNLGSLHFRAYRIDLEKRLAAKTSAHGLLPSRQEIGTMLQSREPDAAWRLDLPKTADYRLHTTYDIPEIDRPGAYVIVASTRADFKPEGNQRAAVTIFLGDLVLMQGDTFSGELLVRSGSTGERLAGVEVSSYRWDARAGVQEIARKRTGDDGTVSFELNRSHRSFAVARRAGAPGAPDDELAYLDLLASFDHRREERRRALVYTDRAVYRPRQELHFKTVVFRGDRDAGSFKVLPDAPVEVELLDANGEKVAATRGTTNTYGSVSGTFGLPPGRLLGAWSLNATSDGRSIGRASVRVEEYKRPTFDVEIQDPSEALRLNRPATLPGEARYYFGLPVTGGKVTWLVRREPRWFLPYAFHRRIFPGPSTSSQIIAHGETRLGADGRFELTFTPEADERLADEPGAGYRYRLEVEVTDPGGETRSARRTFEIGFVTVVAEVGPVPSFLPARQKTAIDVHRRDPDGTPRPGHGTWRLLRLEQPEEPLLPAELPSPETRPSPETQPSPDATAGDALRPRWQTDYDPGAVLAAWEAGEEIARGEVEHGEDGRGEARLPQLSGGAYRLHYTTEDDSGARFETSRELVVEGGPLALAAFLGIAKSTVEVGDTAKILVRSGLRDQPFELAVYRDRRLVRRYALRSGGKTTRLNLPIGREDRGGLSLRLELLRDHQRIVLDDAIDVPWSDRRLAVEFDTFRDVLRPGSKETWTVTVKGPEGAALEAGAAELLASMVDKSLDLFAPYAPPRPVTLYPSRYGLPYAQINLGVAPRVGLDNARPNRRHLSGTLRTTQIIKYDSYGIGGPGRRGGLPEMVQMRTMKTMQSTVADAPSPSPPSPAPATGEATASASFDAAGTSFETTAYTPDEPPRSDFAETAFWEPHLIVGDDGSASFEFTVPDALTEWSVWVHALTRDFRAGHLETTTRTRKELMVRPYLPRFLRSGDRAEVRVAVQNAGEKSLAGTLDVDIVDPATGESLAAAFGLAAGDLRDVPFSVVPQGSDELVFELTAPSRLGPVAFEARGRATLGNVTLGDGERRVLPVLPSRIHLAQSRFAALDDADRRVLTFEDLEREDPTRENEQLVVTLDGQLLYGVLGALPYLVEYPLDCTEQLLNRFLSTGIVTSVYGDHPAVAAMAAELGTRETRLERFDDDDPNRAMTLEETPWLVEARGGEDTEHKLLNVLDPKLAAARRDIAFAKLREAQLPSGGFPWWPGGPPSPFMTLYLVDGFSRALEFGVEMPEGELRPMIERAFRYLHGQDLLHGYDLEKSAPEALTYLQYVLSNFPDEDSADGGWTGGVFTADDRRLMLEHSLKHWRDHAPRLKGYLALVLVRAGRGEEARRVLASVMDSAKTDPDLGTYWAPEERAWLFYNDTIETHAFILRVLSELDPDDPRRSGLVQWLFLHKKLNHWKSTRATAEVLYSLVHSLDREGILAAREEATVEIGGRRERFVFSPERYTGDDARIVLQGEEIGAETAEIEIAKVTPGLLFASATWHFSTEELPAVAEGDFFNVERRFFRRVQKDGEWILEPLVDGASLAVGDQLEVELVLRTKHEAEYVHLRDPRPAGFEPETLNSGFRFTTGVGVYEEIRDSGANYFFERLPVGELVFRHRLRAQTAGTFRAAPAEVQSMYAPEFVAYSSGSILFIAK